ncbi:MAG: hypothetical protein WC532_08065 [Candidatus Omnitrophota bacterium]
MRGAILCALTSLCFLLPQQNACGQDWEQLKSEHFIVYFTNDPGFAKNVLDKSEYYYKRIAGDLGYARYSEFWTWDNRVKIYIYPDHKSFISATHQPYWSQGMADYRGKKIISYAWSKGFVESLLPHEMAHLIFRDFVGFKGEVPLWLDEGIAQWAEKPDRNYIKAMASQAYKDNLVLPLEEMMVLDVRKIRADESIYINTVTTNDNRKGVLFLSGEKLVNAFYLQAVSLVDFLIVRFGSEKFIELCRQLRDGKSLEEALRFVYPMHIRSIAELDNEWRKYLEEKNNG